MSEPTSPKKSARAAIAGRERDTIIAKLRAVKAQHDLSTTSFLQFARIAAKEGGVSDRRITQGQRTWAATTIRTLDAISRTRALSQAESDRLYQAIRDEQRREKAALSQKFAVVNGGRAA